MFDLSLIEDYIARHLKVFILFIAALFILVGLVAVSIFFIAVRGAEETMVPDVRGRELTEALLELQVKELYPRIMIRYSQTSKDKGLILEQEPNPGTIVKAGRRIRLVVSNGVIINKVENFIGRNIDEVTIDLQTMFAVMGSVSILQMKEPVIYTYSPETPGTILSQKPEPGTDISGPITLEFVVSRGQENTVITVPQLTGLHLSAALDQLGKTRANFSFITRNSSDAETGETIVNQNPAVNAQIAINQPIQLTVTIPDNLEDNEVFSVFRYTIPPNPYPLAVRLEALLPTNERVRLIATEYLGGEFTVPYRLPVESILILSMLNRELRREIVGE
jgi:beta-lactam-binding protein with PASTA domain